MKAKHTHLTLMPVKGCPGCEATTRPTKPAEPTDGPRATQEEQP